MTTIETTETPKPVLTALLPDTERRVLSCKLTPDEFKARSLEAAKVGQQASQQEHEIERIKERAKADVKLAEEKHDQLVGRLHSLFAIMTNGAEEREVLCARDYNRKDRKVAIRRYHSGEFVDSRDMTEDEIRRGCEWVFDYEAKKKRLTHTVEGDVVQIEDLTDKELQTHLALPVRVSMSLADWGRVLAKPAVHERFVKPEGADVELDWVEDETNGTVVAEIATKHLVALQRMCSRLEPPVVITELGVVEKTEGSKGARNGNGRKGRTAANA